MNCALSVQLFLKSYYISFENKCYDFLTVLVSFAVSFLAGITGH